jgi:hypothetical protein
MTTGQYENNYCSDLTNLTTAILILTVQMFFQWTLPKMLLNWMSLKIANEPSKVLDDYIITYFKQVFGLISRKLSN